MGAAALISGAPACRCRSRKAAIPASSASSSSTVVGGSTHVWYMFSKGKKQQNVYLRIGPSSMVTHALRTVQHCLNSALMRKQGSGSVCVPVYFPKVMLESVENFL